MSDPPPPARRPLILFALTDPRVMAEVGGMLRVEGYEVVHAPDADATRRALRERAPQGLVLSTLLPGCDPWRLLVELRAGDRLLPIVMAAPVYIEDDATRAYRLGADDYITYALSRAQGMPRIAARFRRLLRPASRSGTGPAPAPGPGPAGAAPAAPGQRIVVDPATRTARADGTTLDLTALEFDLLAAFVTRPERVLSRGQLLREVWGDDENADARRVKYAVLRLRHKIAEATGGRTGIATVRGVGYRYRPPA
ncbi:response regulator transcription factor [Streptomyces sp. NPDC048659]|uniref:response regulator transcription factor n=1 Tax=Streptomyces sp. NPDC048659 TaxID=3155489 RepID=UPI0034419A93